jgi:hypothetical protein
MRNIDFLQYDIINCDDMPSTLYTIKTMKEHRNSFAYDTQRKRLMKSAMQIDNQISKMVKNDLDKDGKLSLDFRK